MGFTLPTTSNGRELPNVVLVYIDDLGYGDVGCYGCQDIPTPHIDRLADEGVRFTASHITNPPCCPSRCSLMMGQYAQRFGKYGMSRGLPIPEDRPTLARFMSTLGYVTGQIGKWDIGTKQQGPLQSGFKEVAKKPPGAHYSEKSVNDLPQGIQKALKKTDGKSKYFYTNRDGEMAWLTDYDGDSMVDFIDRNRDQPFFLYWSPEAVHSPSAEVPERLMKRTTAKGTRRKLAGAIVSVDDQVGKLIAVLEKHGLRDNTLIIFSSDNGANGGEGGTSTPYTGGKGEGTQKEGWVRVPSIISMPGTIPQGIHYDGLIANFDFYSTIAARTGHPIPPHCDGVDLVACVNDPKQVPTHEYLFWLNNEPGDAVRRHLIAVRWKEWRLYRKYEQDHWQLFNLETDPREENDVAAEHPNLVTQLAKKHASWEKTLAPLAEIPQTSKDHTSIPRGYGWMKSTQENKSL